MTTSILEQTRQYHEDIEIGEKVASKLLGERAKRKAKFRPIYDHAVQETLLNIQESSRRVLELYADQDHLRNEEISILGGNKQFNITEPLQLESESLSSTTDDSRTIWQNFYDQLKEVKDYHRVHTHSSNGIDISAIHDNSKDISTLAAEAIERCNVSQLFNADECLGRRVDMSSLFLEFTNLSKLRKYRENEYRTSEISRIKKKIQNKKLSETDQEFVQLFEEEIRLIHFQEIDYISYLKIFDDFRSIPRYCKYRQKDYLDYLNHVLMYLQDFLRRLNPLTNHGKLLKHLNDEFKQLWTQKTILGWETMTHNLPYYSLPTDRLFTSHGIFTSHIEGAKYKKELTILQSLSMDEQQQRVNHSEEHDELTAQTEFLIQRYKDILSAVIQRTIEHLQKKQSRTLRELEMEGDDSDGEDTEGALAIIKEPIQIMQSDGDSDDDDDSEKPVYNPLNLPLGWDGKPIPFWLYKLHGLGIEFKCEICGNYSYWGRRAFERHFQEWRHAFGMRCLKIPNTVHFKEITKIEDAVLLYEQLKKDAEIQTFKVEQDVECEDSEGNVMSARAYEDLRRQVYNMQRLTTLALQMTEPLNSLQNDTHVVSQTPSRLSSLKIIDNRTGKEYIIPIKDNTILASAFKQIQTPDKHSLRLYDPGCTNTAICTSHISFVDGEKGILRYRGYCIQELIQKTTFEEVSFLLFYGELPTITQLNLYKKNLMHYSHMPIEISNFIQCFQQDAHPMGMLMSTMAAIGTSRPEINPCIQRYDVCGKNIPLRNIQMYRILGCISTAAASIERHRSRQSKPHVQETFGFTHNFLYMMSSNISKTKPLLHPKLIKALDQLFILHAEHELNCSTAALRHLTSATTDVYSSIAGAIGALYGPRHGGANEAVLKMLQSIGSIDNIPTFIERVKLKKEKLMGFGHRVYRNFDPRVQIVRDIAEVVFNIVGREELIEIAMHLEKIALQDPYFVTRSLYPNVDFYSGLIYKALGFNTDFFPILFAIPRCAGWLAHWNEYLTDTENRIMRPFQIYKGYDRRQVTLLSERENLSNNIDNALLTCKVPEKDS